MVSGWLLLAVGAVAAVSAFNAWRPRRSLLLILPSWLLAMIVVELALHLVLAGALLTAALVAAGALDGAVGWAGLLLWAFASGATLPHAWSSLRTTVDVDGLSDGLNLSADAPRFPWLHVVVPLLAPWRRGVKCTRGIAYSQIADRTLRLDVYRPAKPSAAPLPAVVWVHGGAWTFGSRHEQGLPLLNHLAANGWIGFNVDYRLSPAATLPEHVEDVKRAIVWIREHALELGVDPDFIAIAGGSAGGHLAALTALTAGDVTLQPGFEAADASVQAAVPFYGIYDLADESSKQPHAIRQLLEWIVVKARVGERPELFTRISPLHRAHADAPPFFVIHGTADTLVPVDESRTFADRLRAVSREPVVYAEMHGAQHAFDVFPSVRTARVIRAIERFLAATYAERAAAPADVDEALSELLVGG